MIRGGQSVSASLRQALRTVNPAGRVQLPLVTLGIGFVWLVTAYDVVCCQYLTAETELNPLAAEIIRRSDIWTFVGLKIVGTFLATEMLRVLHPWYLVGVVAFEAWLLWFLVTQ